MTKTEMILFPTPENIAHAASLIREGKLAAFPTETVYGLGADATDERAVASIYAAKGRPKFNPLIVHVTGAAQAETIVLWTPLAARLAARFWPGPLTFVLPRVKDCAVALLASAGLDSLAIRCPAHDIAQALLRESARPIVAPSANSSGRLSPTQAQDVEADLGSKISLILDGGPCRIGVESTVLDLTTDRPTLLRPGGVTKEMLGSFLGQSLREALLDETAPKSPGMLLSHYAPGARVRLNAMQAGPDEAFLTFGNEASLTGGATRLNLSPAGNLVEAAANLFSMLRRLDATSPRTIAIAPIPTDGLGAAIMDRLTRAAAPRLESN